LEWPAAASSAASPTAAEAWQAGAAVPLLVALTAAAATRGAAGHGTRPLMLDALVTGPLVADRLELLLLTEFQAWEH